MAKLTAFERGQADFKRGSLSSPFSYDSLPYKEWQRGFNEAYFKNLEKVKTDESRRRSEEALS